MARSVSTKPYLIRAIHEWCLDQGYTPYLTVAVDSATRVPREYVKDGQIVLNLGPEATHQLVMGNELISFSARFSGVSQALSIPIGTVVAIYARENGQGMAFDLLAEQAQAQTGSDAGASQQDGDAAAGPDEPSDPAPVPPGRSHLTRIK